jgi:hypothetical protein
MRLKLTLSAVLLALVFLVLPAYGADDLDFAHATIVNSPRDMGSWPATAHLTSVQFVPGVGFAVEFDKRKGGARWPDFTPPGWDGPLQYTLGMCLRTGDSWTCSAVVEYWQSRLEDEGPGSSAPPERIGVEWFYDGRWGALAGRQPAVGESAALFVCAADCRNRADAWPGAVKERSDVRLVRWGTSQTWSGSEPTPPPPVPVPTPVPTPVPAPDLTALTNRVDTLERAVVQLRQQVGADEAIVNTAIANFESRISALESKKIPVTCKAAIFGSVPISCKLE